MGVDMIIAGEEIRISYITRAIKLPRFHELLGMELKGDILQEFIDIIKQQLPDYKDCFNEEILNRAVILLEYAHYADVPVEISM